MISDKEQNEILKSAISCFGLENQLRMLQEESAEVIHAVNKFMRVKATGDKELYTAKIDQLQKEMIDLEIMLEQMKLVFNQNNYIKFKEEKLARLKLTLEKEFAND